MPHYRIVRKQLTPPGEDRHKLDMFDVTTEEVHEAVDRLATKEADGRDDVSSISLDRSKKAIRATLIGQPAGTRNKYSLYSSLVSFEAVEIKEPKTPEKRSAVFKVTVDFPKTMTINQSHEEFLQLADKWVGSNGTRILSSDIVPDDLPQHQIEQLAEELQQYPLITKELGTQLLNVPEEVEKPDYFKDDVIWEEFVGKYLAFRYAVNKKVAAECGEAWTENLLDQVHQAALYRTAW